ncbi:MAG: hypothetical protein RIQ47_660 [Bacteroidota bacterium]|jgi:phosphate-selective porin OprO/OprP
MKKKTRGFTVLLFLLCNQAAGARAQDSMVNTTTITDTIIIPADQAPMAADPILAKKWNQIRTKYFHLNLGLALILDHNITSQNENSITQVGKIDPATEFRGQRLILSGNLLFFKNPWRYMVSANYNGLDAPQDSKKFSFIDWNLEIPIGKRGGWITVGKQKEGVGYEYVAPGTHLMFMERGSLVPAFVRQRNIGLRYSNSILNHRATYTVGLFNNYWETNKSFSDNGSQVTFRATGLPHYRSDANLLHLGFGYRYSEASSGSLSYKAKPEVNTTPSFINTGTFSASASNLLMFEAINVRGPFSIIGEYMQNFVQSNGETISFTYWQAGGSWFITGENRRYNRNNGNQGKLIPKKNFSLSNHGCFGALEVDVRFTHADLSDGLIAGGTFNRLSGGFSWYPNDQFRVSVNYGNGKLNKAGQKGDADFWQFRVQYEL